MIKWIPGHDNVAHSRPYSRLSEQLHRVPLPSISKKRTTIDSTSGLIFILVDLGFVGDVAIKGFSSARTTVSSPGAGCGVCSEIRGGFDGTIVLSASSSVSPETCSFVAGQSSSGSSAASSPSPASLAPLSKLWPIPNRSLVVGKVTLTGLSKAPIDTSPKSASAPKLSSIKLPSSPITARRVCEGVVRILGVDGEGDIGAASFLGVRTDRGDGDIGFFKAGIVRGAFS